MKELDTSTLKLGRGYCLEGFRTITSYCPEPLSNVLAGWLTSGHALGAGIMSWVLVCFTIERKNESKFLAAKAAL